MKKQTEQLVLHLRNVSSIWNLQLKHFRKWIYVPYNFLSASFGGASFQQLTM